MQAPNSKITEFRCGLAGVIPKQSPDLLKDGQYRSLLNIVSTQEGSLSSRAGVKQVGQLTSSEPSCYFVRKLVVAGGEDPLTPSTNPRYLGVLTSGAARNIYRTVDYTNKTLVASNVDAALAKHWEMSDYTAGEIGAAWAYFACPNTMLKDRGSSPYSTLPKWGIQPATGVVLAAAIAGDLDIAALSWGATDWDGIVLTLVSEAGLSDHDTVTLSGITGVTITTTDGRTDINDAWEIRIGIPDSEGDINGTDKTFRIFDGNGQMVLGGGTWGSNGKAEAVPLPGNLDGGAESSPNNTQPYDWRICYEETDTADPGNPSQTMSDSSTASVVDTGVTYTSRPLELHKCSASLVVWGTDDTRIGYIRVYRRGGILFDAWRLVARVVNPGAETSTIIEDNIADADLQYRALMETDNDPPVTSTVTSPIKSTFSGSVSALWQTANLSSSAFGSVTAGTVVHVVDEAGSEDVYVVSATVNSFRAFFQFAHASGVAVEVNAICGQPCHLTATVGEAVLVAGDPNNPHLLYKSKTASPQAFPVGTDAAGAVTSIGVGTPSNSIVNVTECRGQALCLNVSALFEVAIIRGSLQQPARVAEKGLRGQSAWCKTPSGEVWYLSDDGVYSWDGGQHRKRTEAIDTIFRGQKYNGIDPIDMAPAACATARMEHHRGRVHLLYTNIAGKVREIVCEPLYGDRWTPFREDVYETSSPEYPTTMLYCEPDTQSLIVAVNNPLLGAGFGIADVVVVINSVNITSDWWTSTAPTGGPIPWSIELPWFDMGEPAMKKLFEEVWLDIDPQLYANGVYAWTPAISVDLLLDYSTTPVDTFTLAIPSGDRLVGRQLISLLPNLVNTSGSIYQSYGREARAISFKLSGTAHPVQFQLFRLLMQYQDVGMLSAGAASDWMDLGAKSDKRLYQMSVVFDTAGTDRQIVLESRGGREGKTVGTPQVFTLSSPTDLGSGRCMKVFALAEPTIGKLFRVRPYASATIAGGNAVGSVDLFRIHEVDFPQKEQYPPDIVSITPWDDGGFGYLKYANQIVLEVNTNNVAVTVKLQADGADKHTFTITSTEADRQRNITLPAGLTGYRWRLTCDPAQAALTSGSGMWQLFNHSIKFQQADLGEVVHSKDWDDLGSPYDKRLYTLTLRWDNTGGAEVTMALDLLKGIGGATVGTEVATFTIPAGSGRTERTFPLADNLIAKAVRVYPKGATIPVAFKCWPYDFQKEVYPPDTVAFTQWEDGGYEYDKYANQIDFEVNTNNVAITVQIQADGATVSTFTVTATESDRRRNVTLGANLRGKKWRIFVDPTQSAITSGGGMWQLFSHRFAFQQADKGEVEHSADWTDLDHPFDKYLKTVTLEWDNAGGADVTLAMDTLTGIGGATVNSAVATFVLAGGRTQKTFPLAADTIAKKIKIYPQGTVPAGFKTWKYKFDFTPYPADIVRSTAWKDASAPVDKEPSWLWIDADTAGVAAVVQLQNENGTVLTVSHIGTASARKKNYAIPADTAAKQWRLVAAEGVSGRFQLFDWGFERWQPFPLTGPVDPPEIVLVTPWNDFGYPYDKLVRNLIVTLNTGGVYCELSLETEAAIVFTTIVVTNFNNRRPLPIPCPNMTGVGKLWRLRLNPGLGAIAQLWDWNLDAVQEPPALTSWDSYELTLGSPFFKFVKQGWWMYQCASEVTLSLISDTGTHSVTLPAHVNSRAVERFLLPATWGSGVNKSKTYRVKLTPVTGLVPIKFYPGGSGLEYMVQGGDRHAAYQMMSFDQAMRPGT